MANTTYDVIIVGGGVAGLSAAIYTGGAKLSTMVFDTGKSQVTQVSKVMNYPGFAEGISGTDLIEQCRRQVSGLGVELINREITGVERKQDAFIVSAESEQFESRYLVLATNVNWKILESLGFELEVNPLVPSGKIRFAKGIGYNGETHIPNLYLAGLHTPIQSQAVIAAGQGANIGITIASRALENTYMWHDK
ncbi:NAD(P)/FAD-dependent oxidoreductase [Ferviditalea candida]|uniref:NAD(P)/FAD-dependent oxidoreductase n=1 Tax=Ferviditalea candida TaxID=3108399 RepID=A0ABU5ZHH8_9BACL|nr:NAD(P)/FAD-dependent oxidoreductase [Paenibacillaceae bacterium T2]